MEVDIDRLQIASEEIASYSKEIEGLLDRLYLVKIQVDRISLGEYGISDQLNNMIGQTIQCNVIMKKHSSVLKQAYTEYNQTEVKIEEKYNGLIKNSDQEGGSTSQDTSDGKIPEEIEDLKKKYANQEISDEELIRELVKLYGVKDYTSLPSYLCVINGTKYNPQKKEELVAEIAYALIYIKGGDKYIKEKYKEYEKKYAANYYDRNKNNHNTNYNVAPVDNPPKLSLEDFPAFLAEEEAGEVRENAYSGEELEQVLRTSVASVAAGAAMQYAYSKYGGKSYKGSSDGDLGGNGGGITSFKFSEMTEADIAKMADEYRKNAPIEIPTNAKHSAQSKAAGYEQVTYKWNDGTYKYEVRWHTRTPGAPIDQGNTWVIQRTIPGSGGKKPTTYILSGDIWVPRYEWQAAIDARQSGTATSEQTKILDQGHWKE